MNNSLIGQTMGERYKVIERIGSGGMGTVYRAEDLRLNNRSMAIKIMHEHLGAEKDIRIRFWDETEALISLENDAIVSIRDRSNKNTERPYIVMDYLPGMNLKDKLIELHNNRQWPFLSESLKLVFEICLALEYAHDKGIIHRDIKSANIMFKSERRQNPAYQPVLMDLGIAKIKGGKNLTETGTVVGTPNYMSPEQARAEEKLDRRTDIYSLGIILYELVVGQIPTDFRTLQQAITFHLKGKTPPHPRARRPELSESIEKIILKAIAKNRNDRYSNAREMAEALKMVFPDAEKVKKAPMAGFISVSLADNPGATPADSPRRLKIRLIDKIKLTPKIEAVLQEMFRSTTYQEIVINKEFSSGLSGGRVFEVYPIETNGTPQMRTIVKVGSISLIQKEWGEAYQKYRIHLKLPDNIAITIGDPVFLPDIGWGGLRYPLAGGAFSTVSLFEYCRNRTVTIEQIVSVFNDLFKIMREIWTNNQVEPLVNLQPIYERFLPVHLLVTHSPSSLKPDGILSPTEFSKSTIKKGDYVRLEKLTVKKVDLMAHTITLELLRPEGPYYVRVKSKEIDQMAGYRVGQPLPHSLEGIVEHTRDTQLQTEVEKIFGKVIDLTQPIVRLSDGTKLPNPLAAWETLLKQPLNLRYALIHGDFNTENILVRVGKGTIRLIDFAETREDYVLLDFLRLETEVMTKLVPEVLHKHGLPVDMTIFKFYELLHLRLIYPQETFDWEQLHPDLKRYFTILTTIREEAKFYLKEPNNWFEYYLGLTIHLIGAMKFSNLDKLNDKPSPLPKQVAFWGATTLQVLNIEIVEKKPVLPIQLENYELVKPAIGKGWMAEVYKARNLDTNQTVAIKVVHRRHFMDNNEAVEIINRFQQEARLLAALEHPNIVKVRDYNPRHSRPYIVMDFVDGPTLRKRLDEKFLDSQEIVDIFLALGSALNAAHNKRVIHRDLKPENIMFTADGKVVLTDFGVARLLEARGITLTGTVMGTPAYMSPEQAEGRDVDPRSDVYSLGILLYEICTGEVPFSDKNMSIVLSHHIHEPPPSPKLRYQLPQKVANVILKALHKDPDQRYQTAGALAQALAKAIVEVNPPSQIERVLDTILGDFSTIIIVLTILLILLSVLMPWMPGVWWMWLLLGLGAEILIIIYVLRQ